MRVRTLADWPESEYRAQIKKVTARLTHLIDAMDPDHAEAEDTHGALTILFSDRTRVILSAQPSVRQLWVAMASTGTAVHFNWNENEAGQGKWLDDKGQGLEVYALLSQVLTQKLGRPIEVDSA